VKTRFQNVPFKCNVHRYTMVQAFYDDDDDGGGGGGGGGNKDSLKYLTEIPPHVFEGPGFAERLPPEGCLMTGSVFLQRFPSGHGDAVTHIEPDGKYDVMGPARHPVSEHHRVRSFAAVLGAASSSGSAGGAPVHYGQTVRETEEEQLAVLGELMYQSDAVGAVHVDSP
jgi:hypothetical protein